MSRIKEIGIVVLIAGLLTVGITYTVLFKPSEPTEFRVPEKIEFIKLPDPETTSIMSVEEAILRRRSIRDYKEEPLALQDVSQLLWAAQGITDPVRKFRAAPSAGATYPLEVYVVVGVNGVIGLKEGLYHYDPFNHRLKYLMKGICAHS